MKKFILVAETDPAQIAGIEKALAPMYEIKHCVTEMQLLEACHQENPEALLVTDGRDSENFRSLLFLKKIKNTHPGLPMFILNQNHHVSSITPESLLIFDDILHQPLDNEELAEKLEWVRHRRALEQELSFLRHQLAKQKGQLIGNSETVKKIRQEVKTFASRSVPVLILGEAGTGKELVAYEIHRQSERSAGAFVPIQLQELLSKQIEQKLFGYSNGQLTGSFRNKISYLELAHHGTLFFDEITALSLPGQQRLSEFLDDKLLQATASRKARTLDVRIIAATRLDPARLADKGEFSKVLWQKLEKSTIRVPSLRERAEDLPGLANYFLQSFKVRTNCCVKAISPLALFAMQNYSWPGNIRELAAIIEAAVSRCQYEEIQLHDLQLLSPCSDSPRTDLSQFCFKEAFDYFRHDYFTQLLKAEKGDIKATADRSGIPIAKLVRLFARLGIDPQEFCDEQSSTS